MGGEVLVLGIIAMGTWLIPFFGLPVPIIGLVWGIILLRRRPAKKGLTISGVVLSSIGLFLAVGYTTISLLGTPPDVFNANNSNGGSNITIPPPGSVEWNADGSIDLGEYEYSIGLGSGTQVYWKSDNQFVYIGVKAPTEGWVSIGFIEALRSGGADRVVGYADTDKIGHAFDLWAVSQPGGVFEQDDQIGGQFSMLDWAVATNIQMDEEEDASNTVMEFRRRLNTSDDKDIVLLPGPNIIIWSYGNSDDLNGSPAAQGYGIIELN